MLDKIWSSIAAAIQAVSDFVCGYPLFIWLIGGGLFLFIYSGAAPIRYFGRAIHSLRIKHEGKGQISSLQALASTISSTVGMGNIAGVAIAIVMGGPGAIFWMWVSALVGMASKFFEGSLSIMYKGKDNLGETQGGPMYFITEGLGHKWRPLAIFFSSVGMIGCLCVMQANQLAESLIAVFAQPAGVSDTVGLRAVIGIVTGFTVACVVLGGIRRISKIATRIVPLMVGLYFILIFVIVILNIQRVPEVLASIFREAFNLKAGFGALAGTAIIGARRAMYVNEAGVGTASLMHGASRNTEPIREGLVAMLEPAIDSGLVCTLTALPILLAGNYHVEGVQGLTVALQSFQILIPGAGQYLLMVIVFFFAFSTMFSYSYYGMKCSGYLFGMQNVRYYNYFYLLMIVVSCIISLKTVVTVMDLAFALMSVPTMFCLLRLSPRVKRALHAYFGNNSRPADK